MSRGVVRIGDDTIGTCVIHGPNIRGKVITASSNVSVNNRTVARAGDTVLADCGHTGIIITAKETVSSTAEANLLVARIDDQFEGVYTGKIITSSGDVST